MSAHSESATPETLAACMRKLAQTFQANLGLGTGVGMGTGAGTASAQQRRVLTPVESFLSACVDQYYCDCTESTQRVVDKVTAWRENAAGSARPPKKNQQHEQNKEINQDSEFDEIALCANVSERLREQLAKAVPDSCDLVELAVDLATLSDTVERKLCDSCPALAFRPTTTLELLRVHPSRPEPVDVACFVVVMQAFLFLCERIATQSRRDDGALLRRVNQALQRVSPTFRVPERVLRGHLSDDSTVSQPTNDKLYQSFQAASETSQSSPSCSALDLLASRRLCIAKETCIAPSEDAAAQPDAEMVANNVRALAHTTSLSILRDFLRSIECDRENVEQFPLELERVDAWLRARVALEKTARARTEMEQWSLAFSVDSKALATSGEKIDELITKLTATKQVEVVATRALGIAYESEALAVVTRLKGSQIFAQAQMLKEFRDYIFATVGFDLFFASFAHERNMFQCTIRMHALHNSKMDVPPPLLVYGDDGFWVVVLCREEGGLASSAKLRAFRCETVVHAARAWLAWSRQVAIDQKFVASRNFEVVFNQFFL